MATSSDNSITFLPSETENTPNLKKLLGDVHKLIANYLEEHPEADERSTRRFVAGDVCIENRIEFNVAYVLPKQPKVSTWNLYLKEQISSKKRKFDEMGEISLEYKALKQDRTEEFIRLETECQKEKEKMVEDQANEMEISSKRREYYLRDLTNLKKFCDVFYENYKTSILVYGATDSVYARHYTPFRYANLVLAKQAEKNVLKYTEERDVKFFLNSVISANRETALFYRGGTACLTNKDELIRPFTEQALLAWKDATGNEAASRVPWVKILGGTANKYAITGWPETIAKPVVKNRFEPYILSKEELKQLTQLFQEKTMKFVRNVIPNTRPE
ncbi:hypothetical protein BD770DRAFT_458041 [Pilaira anomala]|nr:hypothetical protein BD770DRAFT_458041 [Pilaira anomala]